MYKSNMPNTAYLLHVIRLGLTCCGSVLGFCSGSTIVKLGSPNPFFPLSSCGLKLTYPRNHVTMLPCCTVMYLPCTMDAAPPAGWY